MTKLFDSDVLIAGGGLAGLVTALEALRAGKTVTVVDRDTPERLGGLALWAFGGMALVGTPLQAKMRIPDTPEVALRDWIRFGELNPHEEWPIRWAQYYVEHSRSEVYDWLRNEGIRFAPAVNWVERGMNGEGNSLPRYHVVWGTSRELVRCMVAALQRATQNGRLTLLHRHRINGLDHEAGKVSGAVAIDEASGEEVRFRAPVVVLGARELLAVRYGEPQGVRALGRRHWPEAS